jgi:hypothetical protein
MRRIRDFRYVFRTGRSWTSLEAKGLLQTGTYLFVGAQTQGDDLVLNKVARVVESDIQLTNVSFRYLLGS